MSVELYRLTYHWHCWLCTCSYCYNIFSSGLSLVFLECTSYHCMFFELFSFLFIAISSSWLEALLAAIPVTPKDVLKHKVHTYMCSCFMSLTHVCLLSYWPWQGLAVSYHRRYMPDSLAARWSARWPQEETSSGNEMTFCARKHLKSIAPIQMPQC